jgi:transposase, IS6 family
MDHTTFFPILPQHATRTLPGARQLRERRGHSDAAASSRDSEAALDAEIDIDNVVCLSRGTVALADDLLRQAGLMRRHDVRVLPHRSSFAGFRFPSEVIIVAVRWYLRYGLSYRDVEELLAERGIPVDHVSVYRWVQRFTPLLITAARPCRHAPGDRWFVDETYVKVAGRWVYLYRAIDQYGQVIDVLVSEKRDLAATRRFFTRALDHGPRPTEVSTDRAPAYPRILDELLPTACHLTEQYSNNAVEADHGRLKARLRPMRGLNTLRSAHVISTGHAFVQNLRRGHYELATHVDSRYRIPAAFAELAHAI